MPQLIAFYFANQMMVMHASLIIVGCLMTFCVLPWLYDGVAARKRAAETKV